MSRSDTPLPCRLLVEGEAAGAWQMAVDEALLEEAAAGGTATLRFYGWSEPTLSLGYFQGHRERLSHAASIGCPLVRRLTGGGAILHDRELTYCLTVPVAHPLAADTTRLYDAVHGALVDVLADWGIAATVNRQPSDAPEPFLCFQRRATGDVLSGAAKICGSAQRRRRGAVLQHGSLLLAASGSAPELPGLRELTGREPRFGELAESWQRGIAKRLLLATAAGPLSEAARVRAEDFMQEKYTRQAWNERR